MGLVRRVVAGVVLVALCGGVPAASVGAQEVDPPGRVGRFLPAQAVVDLADQSTTVGAVVVFDLTPVFSGAVGSYDAASSDPAIVAATVDEWHTCALRSGGNIACWKNHWFQLYGGRMKW